MPKAPKVIDLKKHLEKVEVKWINQALRAHGGIVQHAADSLGLNRTTLVEKLRKYGARIKRPATD